MACRICGRNVGLPDEDGLCKDCAADIDELAALLHSVGEEKAHNLLNTMRHYADVRAHGGGEA